MKRKFLLFVCAVLGMLQANAYTTDDLLSDGWSLAPNFSSNKDYVYVLVDAGSSNYAVSRNISDINARPVYVTLPNPFTTPSIVWTFETRNNGLAMRNIDSQYYFNGGTYGWDSTNKMASTYDNNASFTFTSIGDNKYSIQRASGTASPGMYVGPWNDGNKVDSSGEDVATNKTTGQHPDFYIYQMAKATYALKYIQNYPNLFAPVDVSFLIVNPTIYQGGSNTSMPGGWEDWDCNTDYRTEGTGNTCLKGWKSSNTRVDYYQTLSNLPGGKYRLTAALRDNKNNGKFSAYVYQDPTRKVSDVATSTESDHTTAYLDVTTGTSINIGARTDGNSGYSTLTADNFRLQVNPYLSTIATALSFPGSTSLTAGLWYYYDIPAANSYDFTSSAAATIYYTTATDPLLDASTTSEEFTLGQTKEITLPKGRVYFKASAATTFSVVYRYNVASATLSNADGSYTQSSTFSVTFTSATTNDPSASVALAASSKATVNGNEVALSAVTNGFSLNLGSLAANTDYVISIPAGVYGYAGESMNEAINITLHTPTVFDGEYVLYDAATEMFLGRGSGYGTEAVLDKYGVPFKLVTDATGTSSIEFVDWTGVYLFITGTSIYTDDASTGWTLNPVVGGYTLSNVAKTAYATHATGSFGEYVRTTDNSASATVWTLMTKSERDAIIAAYPTENKSNVIAASGISTTAGDFETFLSNNYNAVDCTSAIGTATFSDGAGDWTWTGSWRAQDGQPAYGTNFVEAWNATGAWTQTVDKANLPAGIYKVTVQGYERRKDNDAATALYTAGYNLVSTFLSANGEQVRFTDWNEVDEKPTNTGGAVTAFAAGEAVNTVYVYLDGNTDLNLMVRKPNYIWDCWIIFNNFTLTRYDQTEVTVSAKAGKYGTVIFPFTPDVTGDTFNDITFYSCSSVNSTTNNVQLTEVDKKDVAAKTPYLIKNDGAEILNTILSGKNIATEDSYTDGLLTGVMTASTIPASANNYVLQTQDEYGQAFYSIDEAFTATPYKCYLTYSAGGGSVKAFGFELGDIETGIDGLTPDPSLSKRGEEIYNLAGQRLSKAQKGVNIINGKKVLVK